VSFAGQSWVGLSASRLGGDFACGIVANRLPEVRRTEMHEGVVISWLLEGSGTFTLEGTRRRLEPGCTCLRRPDRRYALELDGQVQHVRCFLKLPEQAYPLLTRLLPGLSTVAAVHPLAYDAALVARISAFIHALGLTDDRTAYRCLPEAIDLLFAMTALASPAAKPDALARAAALLQDPDCFRLPLPDVARMAGLSYASLRKGFAARYGLPPGQYRLRKKIEFAQQALAWGDSISDVVERCGFADVYGFGKQFRAMTGETPGQYRRHHIV